MKTCMIAGGGTGGHIFPALALGDSIRRLRPQCQLFYVGTAYGMERELIPARGERLLTVPMRGLLGKGLRDKLALAWRIPVSLILSFFMIMRFRPNVLVGVGGYASLPLLWVGGFLRIPVVLQEQNAFPGLANRFLSRFARLALLGFREAAPKLKCPCLTTGNPVRESFYRLPVWSKTRRVILVVGGSQGARCLNEVIPKTLCAKLDGSDYKVVHQCGRGHSRAVEAAYSDAKFQVQVSEFIDDMPSILAEARLVICRSGASTISELKAAKVPAILVPFAAAAHDHQTHNAISLESIGSAIRIAEHDLDDMANRITEIIVDDSQLAEMANAYPAAVRSDDLCAEVILRVAQREPTAEIIKRFQSHVS